MRKVFLITGFNNWGKTFLIKKMFHQKIYHYNKLYKFLDINFCVQPQSNDDLKRIKFQNKLKRRFEKLREANIKLTHICAAFCPTKEQHNNSVEIIKELFSKDEVHIIAIKHKWCLHGQLNINQIEKYYSDLKYVTIHTLTETDKDNKMPELTRIMQPLL